MIFLLTVLTALLGNALSQQQCPLPTQTQIEDAILNELRNTGGDGSTVDAVLLLDHHYNCLATSDRLNRYRSITVAVRYNETTTPSGSTTNITETRVSQLQLQLCDADDTFRASDNTLEDPGTLDVFNLPTRRNCTRCTDTDPPGFPGVFDADNNCQREYKVYKVWVLRLL